MKRSITVLALLIAMPLGPLVAAETSGLATFAAQGALMALAKDYKQQTGQDVKLVFETSPNITKRVAAGEVGDILVAQAGTIDQVIKDGKAIADTRVHIGKIALGVAMSQHASRPDISSVDALKASLLKADAVYYSQGASGLYIEKLFRDIGIADQLKGKASQLATGTAVMARLGESHGNDIGFTMISEIKFGETHGGSLVGPLPAAIQNYTPYDAVAMTGAPAAARAFVKSMTTPAAKKMFSTSGWEF